jgi:hypothetical protein
MVVLTNYGPSFSGTYSGSEFVRYFGSSKHYLDVSHRGSPDGGRIARGSSRATSGRPAENRSKFSGFCRKEPGQGKVWEP